MYPSSYERFANRDWDDDDVDGSLSFALVGLGGFTREWIVPSIEESSYAETTCVVSGDREKADAVADEAGATTALTYEEFEDGVERDAYDAVYVATPNGTHLDLVTTAAEQGKHVLCEKPMETSGERAERMVDVCADAGVSLMIAYRLHFNPVCRWVRQLIASGEIGDPVHVRGSMSQQMFEMIEPDPDQWRLQPDLSGGAALIDLGIYPLNTTRFLLDRDPVRVQGVTRSPTEAFADVDENVAFTVEFEDDVLGSYTASQNAVNASHLHVTGTEGEIRLEPAFFGEVTASIWDGDRRTTVDVGEGNEMREEFDYFASRVLTDRPVEPDGRHGVVDQRAIDAIYEAAETSGTEL